MQIMKNRVNQEVTQFYINIDGQEVPVSEEVYRAYNRPNWAEDKRIERQKRCQISNGKGGLKRCTEDCSKCSRTKDGSVLSLDRFEEESEFTARDQSQDIAEIVVERLILEELFKVLEELDPNSHRICELIMEGHTKREIARIMSIPQSSFEYQFKKLMRSLKSRLENYI